MPNASGPMRGFTAALQLGPGLLISCGLVCVGLFSCRSAPPAAGSAPAWPDSSARPGPPAPASKLEAPPPQPDAVADFPVGLRSLASGSDAASAPSAPTLQLELGKDLDRSRVRVTVPAAEPATSNAVQHLLVLDNRPARLVADRAVLSLRDLAEDAELASGVHRVALVVRTSPGSTVPSAHHFEYDDESGMLSAVAVVSQPGLIALLPPATLNGESASNPQLARFDYVVLGDAKGSAVKVRIDGPVGTSDARALLKLDAVRESRPGTLERVVAAPPYAIEGLVSGDYGISLTLESQPEPHPWLVSAGGQFTVNRDLSAPEP